jgi:hypothetical protein
VLLLVLHWRLQGKAFIDRSGRIVGNTDISILFHETSGLRTSHRDPVNG